jgi:hypothetical protein
MFPIKYIDNNLVWNKDNEVFAFNVIWIFINAESYSPTVATLFVSLDISIQPRYRPVHSRIRQ